MFNPIIGGIIKFTVVFPSHESYDLSIGVVFTPVLVWMKGDKQLLNPHPSHPHYRKGDLQYFFDQTDFRKQIATHSNKVAVLVHPTGHGTEEYLNFLPEDLKQEGFEPEVVYL